MRDSAVTTYNNRNRRSSFLLPLFMVSLLLLAGCGKDSSDDTTQLGAVTGLAVTAGDNQNSLTWDVLEGAVSYNIYWEEASTARTSGRVADCSGDRLEGITDNPYTQTDLTNGVEYRYGVTGVDTDGNEGECGSDIVSGTPVASGSGSKPNPQPVYGCTDPTASNYNSAATADDGSCVYAVIGCTDPTATNYNPSATKDDGSCVYADTTPPVTTVALAQVSVTGYTWTGSATIDEAGTGYCIALAAGSPAPTAAQVKAGTGVGTGGTVAMTANVTANCQVTGLFVNTTYDFYFVAEDTSTNLQLDVAVSGPVTAMTPDPLITSLVFTDANLAICVTGGATSSGWTKVSQMTSLDCSWLRVPTSALSGIEQLTALTWLDLSGNQIVDVAPLAGLTGLKTLYLWTNQIVDVTPLAGLTALTTLSLAANQIVDVAGLSTLTALKTLWIDNNLISNVTPLSTLIALTTLDLNSNQIVDVTPLSTLNILTSLSLWGNQIVDVTPISVLTTLTSLNLWGNQITNVASLSTLTALTWLNLGANQIAGQGFGNVHLLSPAPTVMIGLANNLGMSCAELGTLLFNYPGKVDLEGNLAGGDPGDIVNPGVTCTNP